jgi:hypothetical protein
MTENILTIVFGCLATVLAIASIILACLQFRAHIRHSANDVSPSAMENAHSLAWTASGRRGFTPGRSNYPNIHPIVIFDGQILASVCHCARRSIYCASLTELKIPLQPLQFGSSASRVARPGLCSSAQRGA